MVRVPIWLHEALARRAKEDKVSMNSLINSILSGAVSRMEPPGVYPPWKSTVETAPAFDHRTLPPAISAMRDMRAHQTIYELRVDDRMKAELGDRYAEFVAEAMIRHVKGKGAEISGSGYPKQTQGRPPPRKYTLSGFDPSTIRFDDVSFETNLPGTFVAGAALSGAGTQTDPVQVKLQKMAEEEDDE
jgi:hypothetical protein